MKCGNDRVSFGSLRRSHAPLRRDNLLSEGTSSLALCGERMMSMSDEKKNGMILLSVMKWLSQKLFLAVSQEMRGKSEEIWL